MLEQFISQCFYDEIVSTALHDFPDRHDPYVEPLPTRKCPCCVHLTVDDDDDEEPTSQDEFPLLNISLSQSAVPLPSDPVHVPIFSTLSSVPEHLSMSTAATPIITTSDSESPLLRCPAAEVVNTLHISSQLSSLNHRKELVLSIQNNAQKSHTRPTNKIKSHSEFCGKKKVKGKKRARDTSGTEEDNGRRQTKRKKGKGSNGAGNGSVLRQTQSGHVTDRIPRDSHGTRSLERRVLEDITNKVLHAVT
ncbi:hypothetical protein EDD18DRAFT_1100322 [Armillaria luteobubalina]|uniref:Uncharacterized protein n=1 Tax=Armillaria luteobubalina TaxID=153913 RepID=A0AA39V2Z3_9AGAR|nr:hypothetical protein EDD18DRAFT_1100322 [Armillaria luteobubalina]